MSDHYRQVFTHSPDTVRQIQQFAAAHLTDCPVRDDAVRALGEIAADLTALDRYPEYEVRLEIADLDISCTVAGVPACDCTPELDADTGDGYWPGTGPGKLLSIEAHEADDGTQIDITWERQPTPA